jgi:hypothetical protein
MEVDGKDAPSSDRRQLQSVVNRISEFLMAAFHMVLHARGVYPAQCFKAKLLYGIQVYECVDEQVKEYIKEVVSSVRGWLRRDTVQQVVLVLSTPIAENSKQYDEFVPPTAPSSSFSSSSVKPAAAMMPPPQHACQRASSRVLERFVFRTTLMNTRCSASQAYELTDHLRTFMLLLNACRIRLPPLHQPSSSSSSSSLRDPHAEVDWSVVMYTDEYESPNLGNSRAKNPDLFEDAVDTSKWIPMLQLDRSSIEIAPDTTTDEKSSNKGNNAVLVGREKVSNLGVTIELPKYLEIDGVCNLEMFVERPSKQ